MQMEKETKGKAPIITTEDSKNRTRKLFIFGIKT